MLLAAVFSVAVSLEGADLGDGEIWNFPGRTWIGSDWCRWRACSS